MSIYAKLILAVLVFLAGAMFGIRWEKGEQAIKDRAAYKEAEAMRAKRASVIDTAAQKHEADKSRIRTEYLVITERVNELTQSDFYARGNLCFDDSGLRIVRDTLGASSVASQPSPAVRPASAPR